MGTCIKMFVVVNCLGGVIEAGIQGDVLCNSNSVFHIYQNTLAICHISIIL